MDLLSRTFTVLIEIWPITLLIVIGLVVLYFMQRSRPAPLTWAGLSLVVLLLFGFLLALNPSSAEGLRGFTESGRGFVGRTAGFLLVENWAITVPMLLGLAAVYLLLPRPRPYPFLWGAGVGVLALVAAVVLLLGTTQFDVEPFLFYLFSAVAIIAGALMVTQHNPARAALSFALVVLSTCGLFLLLAAPFLMAATVIIYAGAIIVTFLFLLMLAQQEGRSDADDRSREPLFSAAAGFLLLGTLLYVLKLTYGTDELDGFTRRAEQIRLQVDQLRERVEGSPDRAELKNILNEAAEGPLARLEKTSGEKATGLLPDVADWQEKRQRGSTEDAGSPLFQAVQTLKERAVVRLVELHGQATRDQPVDSAEVRKALAAVSEDLQKLEDAAGETRSTLGTLQPAGNRPLSNFSGPPSKDTRTRDARNDLRRDAAGRPEMPAENVAYLGRSLFGDYLLAVELGGTLLLVATIGAIAIAHAGRLRP
jgi:NADH:ubiquinone oxidoreductase subunit 6 (subunit J)